MTASTTTDDDAAARAHRARNPLAAMAVLRGTLARVPTAAWVCALVALLNASAWSFITPAFAVPDEPAHYAYTEYLVQHGHPPRAQDVDMVSTSEGLAYDALRVEAMRFHPDNGAVWTARQHSQLRRALERNADRTDGNGSGHEVGGEPWLYYALQAIPYGIAAHGTLIDRLTLMRLLSAMFGAVAVLFIFLFLREVLPTVPRAWSVGALGVALLPMFGFLTGGVNSDSLLYASSAAVFYLLARIFRRGLTPAHAVAIGAAMAAGLMTKFNFIGLAPGVAIVLVLVALRQQRTPAAQVGRPRAARNDPQPEPAARLRVLRLPALALAVAAAPVLLEIALNVLLWDRPAIGASAGNFATSGFKPSLGSTLSYFWQFYLPALPDMTHYFTVSPIRDLWFNGFIGRFGWLETEFSRRLYTVALVPMTAIVALAARALVLRRSELWRRRPELLMYGVLVAGFMAFVALASFIVFVKYGSSVAQTRYLFPLLPLYGFLLALATRGAGRRWVPMVGATIIVLAIAHDLLGQLLVISRYYA